MWLSGVDADVDPREQALLSRIQELLEIDDVRAEELKAVARELGKPDAGAWANELVTLFRAIPARLEASSEDELEVAFE